MRPSFPFTRVSSKGSTPVVPFGYCSAEPSLFRLKSASTLAVIPVALVSVNVSPAKMRAE